MTALTEMHCTRPKAGEGLSQEQIETYRAQLPEWQVVEREGVPRIERAYKFRNFSQALAFTVQAGILAEKEDHHPALLTEWGRVTVTLWTHAIDGLHLNDFILAAKLDQI